MDKKAFTSCNQQRLTKGSFNHPKKLAKPNVLLFKYFQTLSIKDNRQQQNVYNINKKHKATLRMKQTVQGKVPNHATNGRREVIQN